MVNEIYRCKVCGSRLKSCGKLSYGVGYVSFYCSKCKKFTKIHAVSDFDRDGEHQR